MAGFPVGMVLRNLIPIVLFAALIALGLWLIPNGMVKGFQVFGKIIVIIITIGLAARHHPEAHPPHHYPGHEPHRRGRRHRGRYRSGAGGAFPLVFVITKVFQKPRFKWAGYWV